MAETDQTFAGGGMLTAWKHYSEGPGYAPLERM